MINFSLLLVATGLFCSGHVVRNIRWRIVLGVETSFTSLLASLNFSYALNTVVPFRLGELFRVIIPHKKNNIELPRLFMSLLYEKIVDFFCVTILLILIYFFSYSDETLNLNTYSTILKLLLSIILISLIFSRNFLKNVFVVAKNFKNQTTLYLILINACVTLQTKCSIKMKQIILLTMLMWTFYVGALMTIAHSMNVGLFRMATVFWGQISQSTYTNLRELLSTKEALLVTLVIALPLIVFSITPQLSKSKIYRTLRNVEQKLTTSNQSPSIYLSKQGYEIFLNDLFEGRKNQLQSIIPFLDSKDSVIENISGGSGAATFIVKRQNKMYALKVANNEVDSQRLMKQYSALGQLEALGLPTVKINRDFGNKQNVFGYSTEFIESSQTLAEALISGNDNAILDLNRLLLYFKETIHLETRSNGHRKLSDIYSKKIAQVFSQIDQEISNMTVSGKIHANGAIINAVTFERFCKALDKFPVIRNECLAVHGDLTFENIIYVERKRSIVLMDPNPEQPLVHPTVDFGKILQSIELSYEKVDSNSTSYSWKTKEINYNITKPTSYHKAEKELELHFEQFRNPSETLALSKAQLLLHILRLLPYKLKNEPTSFPYYVTELSIRIDSVLNT